MLQQKGRSKPCRINAHTTKNKYKLKKKKYLRSDRWGDVHIQHSGMQVNEVADILEHLYATENQNPLIS